jgi:hypothetical protein
MNPYRSLGSALATNTALDLAQRLSAWHDAMVIHQRRAGAFRGRRCDPDCPHAQASVLWNEARDVYGERAQQLGFLRTHGELAINAARHPFMELAR